MMRVRYMVLPAAVVAIVVLALLTPVLKMWRVTCANTSDEDAWVTLPDFAASKLFVPAHGGNSTHFLPPLRVSIYGIGVQMTINPNPYGVRCAYAQSWWQ